MSSDIISEAMLAVGLDPGYDKMETGSDVIGEAMKEFGLDPGYEPIEMVCNSNCFIKSSFLTVRGS